MSASIITSGNDTGRGRAWWYDTELVALDPDYAALVAEIDAIGARVRGCPPCVGDSPGFRPRSPAPRLRSSRWPTTRVAPTQRSPPPLE
ncbi:hypothetical protein ATM97_22190 [Nocardia sp. MH4]|uniref:hypothetical protein n=1 Tax=Nocardia sp. MH4 TaxID=1768677 RepID=UPI001C4EF846|nr:hypothetical protein [Nocardia sp. MH4]MBW0272804.1 hypothetical protein [Nocardia sp. MH4]